MQDLECLLLMEMSVLKRIGFVNLALWWNSLFFPLKTCGKIVSINCHFEEHLVTNTAQSVVYNNKRYLIS